MDKLWTGRFKKRLDDKANDFNTSLPFDMRMYRQDIEGSVAHATMLAEQGIITNDDGKMIVKELMNILSEIEDGSLVIEGEFEDIHSFIEGTLTSRIGDAGKRLHTARSRNDQVALDLRLNLRNECKQIELLIKELVKVIIELSEKHIDTVMCGYTHLQRAQPITFAQHLLAFAFMLLRDLDRLKDCEKRINVSPLGSCALSGTGFDINRIRVSELLSMNGICENSLDGVSDRDFATELAFVISLIMMHLSRFSEEIILWCSWEFKYIELDDSFSTGSSIMPQKKNADIAELVRGKTGRAYGNLITLLTMLKGLPLAYNKDMQEDKEAVFDSVDTVKNALAVFAPMLATIRVNKENMRKAAASGFINATDGADYLVSKGLPFRAAYKIMGEIVAYCIEKGKTLEEISISEYRCFSELFDEDIYSAIELEACVSKRNSWGGTGHESIKKQISIIKSTLMQ
ncbi:MAG: argininosuccinate lyase [Clostridiales bacterium GWF2_36_10]|nr:MAG: argininosuccinate lyase [Clostridiales bacterium GWF2_36_10]HAN21767.1 argininosuccinate lyase [Clostridiales bacterium]